MGKKSQTRKDYIAQVKVNIRTATKSGFHKTARWMELILDIAVTHHQADT